MKKYYLLSEASEIVGVTEADIIHFAANRNVWLVALLGGVNALAADPDEMYGAFAAQGLEIEDENEPIENELFGPYYVFPRDMQRMEAGVNANLQTVMDVRSYDLWSINASISLADVKLAVMGDDLAQLKHSLLESLTSELPKIPEPIPEKTFSHFNVSDKLTRMNQASRRYWGNVDRNDRGTHPSNAMVAAWLVEQGFSPTLADKAATIIRPEWAPTGRKPEE